MFRHTLLAAAIAALSTSAFAADYYLVTPIRGKTVNASAIKVTLAQSSLPAGRVGDAYAYDLKPLLQVAGDAGYSGYGVKWMVVDGKLPAGLVLNADTGVINGAPGEDGAFDFSVQAAYKTKSGTAAYQVAVATITVALRTAPLAEGKTSTPYSYDFKPLLTVSNDSSYANSGVSWDVAAGALPAGLTLNASAGTLTGSPSTPGTSTFTIRATYKNKPASQAYTMVVASLGDIKQFGAYRAWADGTYADSCKAYRAPAGKTYSGDIGDGLYRIQVAGLVQDVHCDMTTDGGGWTMWYSSSGYYHIATDGPTSVAYGTHGYSKNLRSLPFREILYVQHSTGNKDWFTRDVAGTIRVVDYVGANNVVSVGGAVTGTWSGKGGAVPNYKYELTIGDYTWMQVGLMMSGHTDTCWKMPGAWCSDTSTNFYRLNGEGNGVNNSGNYGGVAFRQNGHLNVTTQLMSVGVR